MRGEMRNVYRVLVGNVIEGDNLRDLGADRRIIFKFI